MKDFDSNWATKRPRQGELKNMPTPPQGLPSVKIKDAENFVYLHLNFISETGSLRGQNLNGDGDYVVTSYGTPIGLVKGGVHFINVTDYSRTTAQHQHLVLQAWESYDPQQRAAEYFPELV